MKRWIRMSPPDALLLAPFLLALLALLGVFVLPFDPNGRGALFLVVEVTILFAVIVHLPFLKDHGTIADSCLSPIVNTAMITFAVALLGDKIPMIGSTYLLAIATIGIRRGTKYALGTALLSSLGFLIARGLMPSMRVEDSDAALLVSMFFLIALLVGSLSDAARRKAGEFENVVTRSREAIMILDGAGNFEFLNPAALAMGGYRANDLLGHSFFEFISKEDHANARAVWESLPNQPPTHQMFEVHLRRKDGEWRTLSATLALHDSDAPRYLVTARDITTQEIERKAHERRHRDLEAERAVASAVSEAFDMDTVLDIALEQALATLRMDAGAIYLADDAQKTLTLTTARNLSDTCEPELVLRFGEGLAGLAAAERRVILAPNLARDASAAPAPREDSHIRSQASVPLMVQNRVVGVLNVMARETRAFTADDAALLLAIAASVAVAIDHARLFDTLEHRVVQRTAELSALNRIAAVVNQSLDLTTVLETALDELTNTLQVRGGWIHLLNQDKGKLELKAERGSSPDIHNHTADLQLDGLLGLSFKEGRPKGVNLEDSNVRTRAIMLEAGYRSLAVVPLAVGSEVVGALALASDQRDRFGAAELGWLTAAGNTLAVTLKNARVFESVERQVKQLGTLREIDQALSSMLDLKLMLETTLNRLEEIVPYDSAAVLLLDGNILRATAARGRAETALKEFALDVSNNIVFRAMDAQRVPIIIDDLREAPEWNVVPGLEYARAWLGAPLVARGEVIGQIGVFSANPGRFTREHSDLVHSFAGHTAIAIANARLHESTRRNAEKVALLNMVARTVGSTIELDDLLETCLRQLLQVIPADSYYIGLYDPAENTIDLRIHYDAGVRYPASKLSASKGLSSIVLKGRKPLLINRLSEERARLAIEPVIAGTGRSSESWLGVPMIAGEDLVGLLAFASYQPDDFDEEEAALLSSVASQVAIAVDNARHHAEVEDQARRDSLTQAFNHGYLLDRLNEEIEQAQANGSTVSLIMLDVDYFKQYNDTYGHVVGDKVLRLIVRSIQLHLKKSDIVGRWGGEEFAIVLPHALSDQARVVAERIRLTLVDLPLEDGQGRPLPKPTVSQGIAAFPMDASGAGKLVDAADQALYVAKNRGRDQIQLARPDERDSDIVATIIDGRLHSQS